VVLQALVRRCCELGARQARPGEFSERAFLNGKLDLTQAEAIADLIAATDARTARAARRALEGNSRRVDAIADAVLGLRVHVEAAIDFADEPIDTLGGAQVRAGLAQACRQLAALLAAAEHGRKLRDGLRGAARPAHAARARCSMHWPAATAPSSPTSPVPPAMLRETVRLDGLELTLVDTAGLREAGDAIEREGMRRARVELGQADLVLLVLDARDPQAGLDAVGALPQQASVLQLCNKADLLDEMPADDDARLWLSAATGRASRGCGAAARTGRPACRRRQRRRVQCPRPSRPGAAPGTGVAQ
jgi:tRNA modification GTPase